MWLGEESLGVAVWRRDQRVGGTSLFDTWDSARAAYSTCVRIWWAWATAYPEEQPAAQPGLLGGAAVEDSDGTASAERHRPREWGGGGDEDHHHTTTTTTTAAAAAAAAAAAEEEEEEEEAPPAGLRRYAHCMPALAAEAANLAGPSNSHDAPALNVDAKREVPLGAGIVLPTGTTRVYLAVAGGDAASPLHDAQGACASVGSCSSDGERRAAIEVSMGCCRMARRCSARSACRRGRTPTGAGARQRAGKDDEQ